MPRRVTPCLMVLLVLAGCGPASWLGVDEITPAELQSALVSSVPPLLIDVTPREEFEAGHIPGSVAVPLDEVPGHRRDILRRAGEGAADGRLVVTVCRSGNRSAAAAAQLAGGGVRVASLAGGKRAWTRSGGALETGPPRVPTAAAGDRPPIALSVLEQTAAVVAGFVVKPTYMLLALGLGLLLLRSRSSDLALVRAGLFAFFAGELACATNYLCTSCTGETLETLHGLGMVVMGALAGWGAFRFLDERLLGLTRLEAGCSLRRFCRRCWKQERAPCLAQRTFLLAAPALALVSLMPFAAPIRVLDETGLVFGTPVAYLYSLPQQILDFRLYPALAAVCFALTSVLLPLGRRSLERVQPLVFAGFGLLSFSLFRFLLFSAYRERPVWLDFWEEVTELFAIVFLAVLAWLYRENLGLARPASGGSPADSPRPDGAGATAQ